MTQTYGFPSMSKLLVETRQLSTQANSNKRYADTVVLIQEFVTNAPTSRRAIEAIARMNYIHGRYQKAGKISNDGLLYTLSVFISEPIFWINRFEWRPLTQMEICAVATFWKSIGDGMGISYDQLAHHKTGWKDGIEFYEDILAWAKTYEENFMVPARSNKETADATVAILLHHVPKRLKHVGNKAIVVLMTDRLRDAMMFEKAPWYYTPIVHGIIDARRFMLRHFSLPRPEFLRVHRVSSDPDPKTGKYHMKSYDSQPYYVRPSVASRWGFMAWLVWFLGGELPGDKGKTFHPDGYIISDVGPNNVLGQGFQEMQNWQARLLNERPTGCPFAFSG